MSLLLKKIQGFKKWIMNKTYFNLKAKIMLKETQLNQGINQYHY